MYKNLARVRIWVRGQKVKVTGTKNEKVRHFFGSGPRGGTSCVVCQLYAGGKISTCCLVLYYDVLLLNCNMQKNVGVLCGT